MIKKKFDRKMLSLMTIRERFDYLNKKKEDAKLEFDKNSIGQQD